MDKIVDARFARLEKALTGLIDSVMKYHPSVSLAKELEQADLELNECLAEVQQHQNNFADIQKLRQASAALDGQIRDTLQSLATTRKDIVNTQTTAYPKSSPFPIDYEELLEYAQRITKTTLPPATILNNVLSQTQSQDQAQPVLGAQTPAPSADGQPQSALTPSAPTPAQSSPANGTITQAQTPAAAPTPGGPSQQTVTNITLPENISSYLDPFSGLPFFPWPTEDWIRGGSLADIQVLSEKSVALRGWDPAKEEERKAAEEAARIQALEAEKAERAEKDRKIREERERLRREREKEEQWSSGGGPQQSKPGGAGEKKQFQFASLDDLDEDDE